MAVVDRERVAWARDDALDVVLIRLLGALRGTGLERRMRGTAAVVVGPDRRMKDDDVADVGILQVIDEAVHQHPLADVERGLHRSRGDLVRLDHEGLNQERQANGESDDHSERDQRAARRRWLWHQVPASSASARAGSSPSSAPPSALVSASASGSASASASGSVSASSALGSSEGSSAAAAAGSSAWS